MLWKDSAKETLHNPLCKQKAAMTDNNEAAITLIEVNYERFHIVSLSTFIGMNDCVYNCRKTLLQ